MSQANFVSVADILDDWRDNLLSGTPPTLFPVGVGELARLEIGPGLVWMLGGAPGAGKTFSIAKNFSHTGGTFTNSSGKVTLNSTNTAVVAANTNTRRQRILSCSMPT